MHLSSGTRLGPYEIFAPLGSGGMGEVYRARDTRLGRDVAIKVLPHELSANADFRARFEREARTVSSFNHPHICTLHDVGREGDTDYLVMELVEGETLADRLTRGRLPTADVLRIGAQLADALERAHRAGVTHRDLKPGNVMLAKAGAKLMDFGLAYSAIDGVAQPVSASMATVALSRSPQFTSPVTAQGTIVGTFQYMAPEQLEGKAADARSDLWALGCVLYEMATGQRAFDGGSQASLIAAIMSAEPPRISERVPMTPPALDRLVQQCLTKDPDERWQSAGDLRRELQWIAQSGGSADAAALPTSRRRGATWIVPATALAALAVGLWIGWRLLPDGGARGSARAGAGVRLAAETKLTDYPGQELSPELSPDGKMLLFVSTSGADEDIHLLRVGGENPINLTENSPFADYDPAFSPDGERIAFGSEREGGGLFVMGATGESPRKLSNVGADPSWSPDGRQIVYSTERVVNPYGRGTIASLWVVDVASGEKKQIHAGDAVDPVWSPSGRRIAFWSADAGQRDLKTIRPDGSDVKTVTDDLPADWGPFWAPDGQSIYFLSDRGGTPDLWRVAIDEADGTVRGAPEPVTTGVARVMRGSMSRDGKRLAIMVSDARSELLQARFDPTSGRPTSEPVQTFAASTPIIQSDLSPDGVWIAFRTGSPGENIMIMRCDGTERRRLTDDAFRNRGPSWVRGSDWVMFYSNRDGHYATWLVRSDGTELRKIASASVDLVEARMSVDGSRLAVLRSGSGSPVLGIAPVQGDWFTPGRPPTPAVIDSIAVGFTPLAWSPDGRHIMGDLLLPRGRSSAMLTLATGSVDTLSTRTRSIQTWTWLPDSRRVLGWDTGRRSAVMFDVGTKNLREVPGIPGPGDLRLSADGRTLMIVRQTNESDIWLLTLE